MVDIPHYLLIHFFIKGCCFINKQLRIDTFLDWKGHHWALDILAVFFIKAALILVIALFQSLQSL